MASKASRRLAKRFLSASSPWPLARRASPKRLVWGKKSSPLGRLVSPVETARASGRTSHMTPNYVKLVESTPLPRMALCRQKFEATQIDNPDAAAAEEMKATCVDKVKPGMSIAL